MKRLFARASLAFLLGFALALGGLAVLACAPASDSGEPGFVKVAEAKATKAQKAKAAKAKKAYKKLLAGSKYKWGGASNASSYSFKLADINGDNVPELFVENGGTAYAYGYSRVYTYYKGKVKLAGKFSVAPSKLYKKSHVLYYWDMHTGSYWGKYLKLSKGKLVVKASWQGTDNSSYASKAKHVDSGFIYYTKCKVGSKSVSYSKYKQSVKKLLKVSKMPSESFTQNSILNGYVTNTASHRAKKLG